MVEAITASRMRIEALMVENRWFVQLGDTILGPVSDAELQELARRGSIAAHTQVTYDHSNWLPAGNLTGLQIGPNATFPGAPPETQATDIHGNRTMWALGLASAAAILVASAILLLVCVNLLSRPSWTAPSAAANAGGEHSTGAPAEVYDAGQWTLRYWQQIGAAGKLDSASGTDADHAIDQLRQAVIRLRALPTAGVDADAVKCGLNVATLFGNMADTAARGNSPALMIESFFLGMTGDPFGTTVESLEANTAVEREFKQVQQELANTRAILSSRYGIEFPAL